MEDSLWGHLDDLRRTLLRTAWIVGMGLACLLCFYEPIVQVFFADSLSTSEAGLIKQKVERIEVSNPTVGALPFQLPAGSQLISFRETKSKKSLIIWTQVIIWCTTKPFARRC